MKKLSYETMGNLRKFYNEDAKQPICTLDPLVMSAKYSFDDLYKVVDEATDDGFVDSTNTTRKTLNYLDGYAKDYLNQVKDEFNEYLDVSDKFITEKPSITYKITRKSKITKNGQQVEIPQIDGAIKFDLYRLDDVEKPENFDLDSYEYTLTMGSLDAIHDDVLDIDTLGQIDYYAQEGMGNKIAEMKLSELSILNSTDYLRAIYDFDNLVNPEVLLPDTP